MARQEVDTEAMETYRRLSKKIADETGPGDLWDVLDDPAAATGRAAPLRHRDQRHPVAAWPPTWRPRPVPDEVDTDALIEEFRDLARTAGPGEPGSTMMPASPSLAARAEALLNRLAQVEAQEADRQARLEIETARLRASSSREALKDALGVIPVLAESGVAPTADPRASTRERPGRGADGHCGQRPPVIVGAPVGEIASRVRSNSVNNALETAEKFSRSLESALNRSVEKKRQEILPAEIDQPIIAYPGASDALAARLERLQTLLQRKVENLPPGELAQRLQDIVSAAASWTADRPRLDEGLDRQHPEVQEFLRQAATEEGAPWSLITPVVQAWLADPENTANLRVVLR